MRRGSVLAVSVLVAVVAIAATAAVLVTGRSGGGDVPLPLLRPTTTPAADADVERVENISESIRVSLESDVPAEGGLDEVSDIVTSIVGARGRVQTVSTGDDAVSVLVVVAPTGVSNAIKIPDPREPATACFLFTRAAGASVFVRTRLPGCEMALAL